MIRSAAANGSASSRTRWIIEGADAQTGEDQTVTIEAADRSRAEMQARQMGLLVAGVRPAPQPSGQLAVRTPWTLDPQEMTVSTLATVAPSVPNPTTTPPPATPGGRNGNGNRQDPSRRQRRTGAGADLPIAGTGPAAGNSAANSATIDYAPPRGTLFDELPPDYRSLLVLSHILFALAIGCYTVGALAVIEAARGQLAQGLSPNSFWILSYQVRDLALAGSPIVLAAVLHAMSAGCAAFRDIARNSFLRR